MSEQDQQVRDLILVDIKAGLTEQAKKAIATGETAAPNTQYFEIDGDDGNFQLVPFGRGGPVVLYDDWTEDSGHAVAQWEIVVRDSIGVNSRFPTHKAVVLRGLHVISGSCSAPRFTRHIDWNFVNSQLGGSRGRLSLPPVPRDVVANAAPGLDGSDPDAIADFCQSIDEHTMTFPRHKSG